MKIPKVLYLSVLLLIGFCVVGLSSHASQVGDTFTYCSTDVPKVINDNSTVISDLGFPASGAVQDVKLSMKITHTFNADLDITLESPDGTMVEVMSDNGGVGDGLGTVCDPTFNPTNDFILDDNADMPVSSISGNNVTGSYIPENPLGTFENEQFNGTWKLHVTDDAGGDTGTLDCWCLEIKQKSTITIVKETVPEGFDGEFEFEGMGFDDRNPCNMFSLSDGESQGCGQLEPGQYKIVETEDNGADVDIWCDGTKNWTLTDDGKGVIIDIGKRMCEYVDVESENSADGLCCDVVNVGNGADGLCCELPPVIVDKSDENTADGLCCPYRDMYGLCCGYVDSYGLCCDDMNEVKADGDYCIPVKDMEADYIYGEIDETVTCTFKNTLPLELSPIFPAVESNPNFMNASPVTTNGPVAFIWGFQLGSFIVDIPCGQIELGINPFFLLGIFNAGANQIVNMSFWINLGGYANPAYAQAVDLTTCVVSDVVPNIILNTNLK